jgi:CRP-like cAMP-binding protein
MLDAKTIKLNQEFITRITASSPTIKYSLSSPLFYQGQVPIVAYLVIDGAVALYRSKNSKNLIKPGYLIGLNELMTNSPSRMHAEVKAESSLCYLDKSTMLEIINNEQLDYSALVVKMMATGSRKENL